MEFVTRKLAKIHCPFQALLATLRQQIQRLYIPLPLNFIVLPISIENNVSVNQNRSFPIFHVLFKIALISYSVHIVQFPKIRPFVIKCLTFIEQLLLFPP